ncbi:hypothetical protein [Xanthocytophaga agilis]|uniref:Uncharacterized protein n=1 Tax=Xanthocytophaga agilis TaxID=3048010 RepID=A0AAE3R628_9BACT|nr:hypothetical protein [Xanthocytophaga agilis]MDJ1501473.1 hypothetical protein [Xanthocytophaga agilis]
MKTISETIEKHQHIYYNLIDSDIRLDKEIYLMKRRIAKIAVDEVKYQARQQFLDAYLAELREREELFQAEDKPEKYKKRTLKQLQREIDKTRGRWHANRWRLSVVYKRKRKDNVVKLLLKELKQAEIKVRIQHTKRLILQLQELEQVENKLVYEFVQRELDRAGITVFTSVHNAVEQPIEEVMRLEEDIDSRVIPLIPSKNILENRFSHDLESKYYKFG